MKLYNREFQATHSNPVSWFEFANSEFVIRSVNNMNTARHKIVNQSENDYG